MNRLAAWRDSMLVKSLMLLLLLGVLCIPLWQIENLIDARGDSQQAARDEGDGGALGRFLAGGRLGGDQRQQRL